MANDVSEWNEKVGRVSLPIIASVSRVLRHEQFVRKLRMIVIVAHRALVAKLVKSFDPRPAFAITRKS